MKYFNHRKEFHIHLLFTTTSSLPDQAEACSLFQVEAAQAVLRVLLLEHPEGDNEGPVPERHSVSAVWDFQEPVLLQEASANEFPAEVPALSEYSSV